MKIAANRPMRVFHVFYDVESAVPVADSTLVATVTAPDGSQSTFTPQVVSESQVSITLPAQTVLGWLSVTWTLTNASGGTYVDTDRHEVIGEEVVTIQDIRASDSVLANVNKYKTANLLSVRDQVLDEFESILGYPLGARAAVTKVARYDRSPFQMPYPYLIGVSSVERSDGTLWTSTDLKKVSVTSYGALDFRTNVSDDLTVRYTYGRSNVPDDLKGAVIARIKYLLLSVASGIPDRATTYAAAEGGGTYSLATAGRAGSEVGIPEVDAVLKRHKWLNVGIA